MQPVFGRNHAMKAMLESYSLEFEDMKNHLSELERRVAAKELTVAQIQDLTKVANDLLYQLNRKVMGLPREC